MRRFLAMLMLMAAAGACTADDSELAVTPTVERAYLAEPIGEGPTAMYLQIRNETQRPASLVAVETEAATQVELHTQRTTGDMMVMEQLDSIPIEPGGVLQMRPGAEHVMLLDPLPSMVMGDTVGATLIFSSGERVEATVPVVSYGELVEIFEVGAMAPRKERD